MNANALVLKDGMLYIDNDEVVSEDGDPVYTLETRKKYIVEFMASLNKKISENGEEDLAKPIEVQVMRQLGIKRYCCKRHLICHIDILDKL